MKQHGWMVELPDIHAEKRRAMPWNKGLKPLASCERDRQTFAREGGTPAGNLRLAVETFCAAGLGAMVELYTDPKFDTINTKLRLLDGWIPEAFVTFVGLHGTTEKTSEEADLLLQSVHHFSTRPILVVNFLDWVPDEWTPERFPNMVLLHGKPLVRDKPFFFNKFRAMLFSKVKTGIVLDADQWANRGLDVMFRRAREETNSEYPYPIMPVHWLSKDPESDDYQGYAFKFKHADAPPRTMRWGHAHPTWTHHALSFLSTWTSYILAPDKTDAPAWLLAEGAVPDEDLMNFGLWAEKATKQWCKFDIPAPDVFDMFEKQDGGALQYQDKKWYPNGIPLMFFTAHDAKGPAVSLKYLTELWPGDDARSVILYNATWFRSGAALAKYDPSLKCLA